jgi:colanic acid biosynthesis glycosyl transferase WcaI
VEQAVRILVYTISYAPEPTATGKFTGEMVDWLVRRGHEVRVVAAPPYYPAWRVSPGYSSRRWRTETLAGARVFRCPLYVPSRPTGLRRVPHLLSFALSSAFVVFWQALRWKPDVVLIVKPTVLCAPAALLAARLTGAKAWLHVQDFEIEASFRLGMLPGPLRLLAAPVMALNRALTRRFDRVSTISRGMEMRLKEWGVAPRKIGSFPNWVDTERLRPDPDAGARYRRKLGIAPEDLMVLYAGNMGRKQGLETLLEAAGLLRDEPRIKFILTGGGGESAALQERARKEGLNNVRFLPLTPDAEMPALLAAADLHLVVQRRGAADLVMPSKLTGILSVGGRALVTADPDTELGRLVGENPGLYQIVPPEDAAALAAALRASSRGFAGGAHMPARTFAEKRLAVDAVLGSVERELDALVFLLTDVVARPCEIR